MMTHDDVLERLDDYVDGHLTEDEALSLDAHLGGCAACRAELEALNALLDEAQALPAGIAPPRDLWAGIEARIAPAAPAVEERDDPKVRRLIPRSMWKPPQWMMLAAAALALMISTSLLTVALMRPGAEQVASGGSLPPATVSAPAAGTAFAAFQPAEQEYQKAIGELETALRTRRGELAPATVATLEKNLAIIDQAIAESREALLKDPNSRELAEMLSTVYDQKVQTLQRAVTM